jgi:PAS domain S-box-containing protein
MEQELISTTEVRSNNEKSAGSNAAARQLRALARVSTRLSSTLLLEDVFQAVLDEALQNSAACSGRIALYDQKSGQFDTILTREFTVATPELDAQVLASQEAVTFNQLDQSAGDRLSSVLVAPILFEGMVAGLLHLFAEQPAAFDEETLVFVGALCDHAAIALGNAQRFTELKERNTLLQKRTQQIEHFLESSRVFHSDRKLEEVYEELVYGIQEGVGFNVVLLSLVEQEGHEQWLQRVTAAGIPLDRLRQIQQKRQSWSAIQPLMRPEFKLGGAYFVPAGRAEEIRRTLAVHEVSDLYPTPAARRSASQETERKWTEGDLFFIPLPDSKGKPLAMISLDAPIDGRRPDLSTARVLEVFANQAASAIENVQLFHNMWDYALQLQQLHNVSQQSLREPDFDRKLQLILDGLQIAGWQHVTLMLHDETFKPTRVVSGGLFTVDEEPVQGKLLPSTIWQRRFADPDFQNYRRGNCYYVPGDEHQLTLESDDHLPHPPVRHDQVGPWHDGAVLYRPLYDRDQNAQGLLALAQPESGRLPDENALQTIDLYAQFATSVIENEKLFAETQRLVEELDQRVAQRTRALAEEVAKVQAILESIADGILVAEPDGTIIVANVPATQILGVSRELLVGRNVDDLQGVYGEEADRWAETISEWASLAGDLEQHIVFRDQMEIEDKVISAHVSPVFANNTYFGTISIFRDITREVEVDRMKSEFVSTVSHELRTPMTSIKGYVDLMLMGAAGEFSPSQSHFLEVIKKNAHRLQILVDDLLDISRIETGKTRLNLEALDVSELIDEVVNGHLQGRIQHEQKDVEVTITTPDSLPRASADHEKVTRILTNLVDNALNYTPDGGHIEVSAVVEDRFVNISVKDSGIGISKENQKKIFERFYRVEDEDVQEIPGTGLGLAIVSNLVEMHGGTLSLDSELGAGSTFTFSLPCVEEKAVAE